MIPQYRLECTDGTTTKCRLYDIATGQEIKNIRSIEITKLVPNSLVSIKVEIQAVELDVTVFGDETLVYVRGRDGDDASIQPASG